MKNIFLTALLLGVTFSSAQAQVKMTVDASKRGPMISQYQYGLFFEEINHAGDGGLYAELVSNRSFEDGTASWKSFNGSIISLVTDDMLNDAQHHALQVRISGASDSKLKGISNTGYWGMNIQKDETYTLSLWVKGDNVFSNKIKAQLRNAANTKVLGEATLEGEISDSKWSKLTAKITATDSDKKGQLLLLTGSNGRLTFDVVSLFPKTWKDRPNGLRPDLAQLLADTKPSFLRFPGGCYVEGEGSYGNAFQWKKTIGKIEERPGHYNQNWHYWSSDGLGYDEYLQMCEDLGAAPMFVVNIGVGHGFALSKDSTEILIQDVLDAIEYANGDETTEWGAKRIANGHAAPYNLKFLEIGNENYQAGLHSDYAERYKLFYDAIKAKYPEIITIGNVEAWGTDNPAWGNEYPVEMVDEHYYRNFMWMRDNYNKYDNYPRTIPVYNGEYAANGGNYGRYGNMNSALGEAVYMLGMERNSDVCQLASFAPIFMHEQDPCWAYDMIHFNAADNFVTPSYYVQKLMNVHLGEQNLLWTESGNMIKGNGEVKVGVGTWGTVAQFDNASLTDIKGNVIASDDFSGDISQWTKGEGNWSVTNGFLKQTSTGTNCTAVLNVAATGNYIYKVRAKKISGDEGFLIMFNFQDTNNYAWWNIGGWGNTQHAVEICTNGQKATYASVGGSVASNRWYDVEIRVENGKVTCLLDNNVCHEFNLPEASGARGVYQSVQIDETNGELIVKVVNPHATAQTIDLNTLNMKIGNGTVVRLASANGTDENTMEHPFNVKPSEGEIVNVTDETHVTLDIPAYSLNIFRLGAKEIGKEVKTTYEEYEKEDEGMSGYLYAHMNRNGEYTNYALSQHGQSWNDMFNGAEVFDTKANTVTGGMRDAFITRMPDGNFMFAGTDMTSRLGWTSNHVMVLMLSPDLVHWTKNVKIDLETPENLEALGGITAEQMTAAWAPQIIYDNESGNFVVYYSVGFPDRHRIYYSVVDKDLNILTRPQLYFDPGYDIIDADIVWNAVDKQYVMIYKCEKTSGFDRATATHLIPRAGETTGTCQWTITPDFHVGDNNQAVEAPTQWRLIGSDKWKLAYINYSGAGYGYKMRDMDEHGLNVSEPALISGSVAAQHGCILKITSAEYDYLRTWEQVKTLLPTVESYYKACKSETIGKALETAYNALNNSTTFAENAKAMNDALVALSGCESIYKDFITEMAEAGKSVDMTALMVNPDFSKGSEGWTTSGNFTQANGYVAEYWNTWFSFYQTVENLPEGEYEVGVQSFYRYGTIDNALNAVADGTEQLNAVFFANGESVSVMSLYDESADRYGVSPYTYPDNVQAANEAFNTYGYYKLTLKVKLAEPGNIKIGIENNNSVYSDWCCFDNFTLKYLGNATGIDGVKEEMKGSGKTYTLGGMEIKDNAQTKGIRIRNGKKELK